MPDDWTTLKGLQQITELVITEKNQEQKNVVKTYKTIDQLMELLATLKVLEKLKFDGFNYNYNIQTQRLQNQFIDTKSTATFVLNIQQGCTFSPDGVVCNPSVPLPLIQIPKTIEIKSEDDIDKLSKAIQILNISLNSNVTVRFRIYVEIQ